MFKAVIFIFCTLVISGIVFSVTYPYMTKEVVYLSVEEKERITTASSSRYLVFCEKEVFKNTDSILYWKFNSSDLQKDLKIGHTYKVSVYGWRVPFLSMYRNIIQVEE